jgi:protein FRA10AC1
VNFSYEENKEKKNALVKLRVCPDCASKLNYKQLKKEKKRQKKEEKRESKKRKLLSIENSSEIISTDIAIKVEPSESSQAEEQIAKSHSEAWKQKPEFEKTKEDEFDEYFNGLFM